MKPLLCAAALLIASTASAQNVWQMNSFVQGQYNNAFASAYAAQPYYGGGYYRRGYGYGGGLNHFYRHQAMVDAQNQTFELRRANRILEDIEFNQRVRHLR